MRALFHKSSDYGIELFNNSRSLPVSWQAFIPAGHFLQVDNLRTSEDALLPHITYCYALAAIGETPVAAAYFQILHLRPEHLNESTSKPASVLAWKIFTQLARPSLLVAGHLFRHDIESLYVAGSAPPFDAFRMHQAMIDAAMRQQCVNAVLVKDVSEELVSYYQHYAPQYMLLRNDISMELDLSQSWISVKDYEKSLKHKYAQRFRKVRAHWETLTIRELSPEETWNQKEVIHTLYNQVTQRQNIRLGSLSPEYIPILKQQYPFELKVWMAYEGESPVAFFSGWAREAVFDMFYIGMDYARNDALQLYFNILFFSVEQAILLQKQKLILGRTALEAKARLGCKPRYLSTFLYIRNRLIRGVVARIQQQVTSNEGEWENRHPFKDHP